MGKHTEGPWQVKGEYLPDCLIVVANVDSDITAEGEVYTYDHIATCVDEYGESSLDAVGNARLIAASPDLLKTLKWALARVGGKPNLIKGQNDQYYREWHEAHDLLERLTGGKA